MIAVHEPRVISVPPQEFDNYAEWDLKDIDFVDDDSDILRGEVSTFSLRLFHCKQESVGNDGVLFLPALKLSVVDIYHSRLKERQRRKK